MFTGLIAVALVAGAADDSLTKKEALARYGAAVWQARRDRLLTAAKSLEAAAKLDPEATAPRRELVRVYTQIGREPDAIRVAKLVLEKTPEDADTAHALAKLLHDAGELKDAAAAAKLAAVSPSLADRPDKALAVYRDLAMLLEATDDLAGSEDAFRKAITLLVDRRKSLVFSGRFTAKRSGRRPRRAARTPRQGDGEADQVRGRGRGLPRRPQAVRRPRAGRRCGRGGAARLEPVRRVRGEGRTDHGTRAPRSVPQAAPAEPRTLRTPRIGTARRGPRRGRGRGAEQAPRGGPEEPAAVGGAGRRVRPRPRHPRPRRHPVREGLRRDQRPETRAVRAAVAHRHGAGESGGRGYRRELRRVEGRRPRDRGQAAVRGRQGAGDRRRAAGRTAVGRGRSGGSPTTTCGPEPSGCPRRGR